MKVLLVGERVGVHERRFIKLFEERGCTTSFRAFDSDEEFPEADLIFGGPLHHRMHFFENRKKTPFVAASYAYDVLYQMGVSRSFNENVKQNLSRAQGIVSDCIAVSTQIDCLGFSGTPQVCCAWGLDGGSVFEPAASKNKATIRKTILSVRNFTPLHGVQLVIDAFREVSNQVRNVDLVLAGDGPLRGEIENMIKEFELGNRISVVGSISEDDIVSMMKESDIYVSASLVDGSSISLLQAMSVGIPVVLSSVGGNIEWAARTSNSILFEPRNAKAFTEAILEALRMERADNTKSLEEFADWNSNADAIFDFCKDIVLK